MIDMKPIITLWALLSIVSIQAQAQKNWQGFNLGADLNYHYLFGGAQVDGQETIGDGHRASLGARMGYTWQWKRDIVFGTEFQINQPFGSFENKENIDGTVVSYTIKPQTAVQFNLGKAFGTRKKHSIQGYFAFNQTRFDIHIKRPNGVWEQTDFENFGRVGLAYQYQANEHISVRLQVGSSMDALEGTENGLDSKFNINYHFARG